MSSLLHTSLDTISNEFEQYREFKSHYDILMTLPIVKSLKKENKKLRKENTKLLNLLFQLTHTHCPLPSTLDENLIVIKEESVENNVPLPEDNDDVSDDNCVVEIPSPIVQNIVYELCEEEEVVVDKQEEEEEEVEVEEAVDEEEEEEETEEAAVEETEEEEEEEEVEETEEAVEEEEEEVEETEEAVEEAVEEEEEEEEVEETEEGEEEDEEEEEEAGEEEEVSEVVINGRTYYTTNEKNGIIYDVDENGDISLEVGHYVNGVAKFH